MSREYTKEEMLDMFVYKLGDISKYWATVNVDAAKDFISRNCINEAHYRTNGVIFSIMSMIDGCDGSMPAFKIVPSPHPDDKQFRIDNDENYWPNPPKNIKEISINYENMLHEMSNEDD
jgi:hypothetical protein